MNSPFEFDPASECTAGRRRDNRESLLAGGVMKGILAAAAILCVLALSLWISYRLAYVPWRKSIEYEQSKIFERWMDAHERAEDARDRLREYRQSISPDPKIIAQSKAEISQADREEEQAVEESIHRWGTHPREFRRLNGTSTSYYNDRWR